MQYPRGVAVVDFQNGGAALRLHAHAFEAELFRARTFVNALRIVVQQEQAVGGGVHHLCDQLEPLGHKVVAFVDQHGLVLAAGDLLAVHGGNHVLHQCLYILLHPHLTRQGLPKGHQRVVAPNVAAHM